MRFKKISITKRGVELTREQKDVNGALEEIHLSSPERPLGSFADAMQAFVPFMIELFAGAIEIEEGQLTITTLNLSEDKNGNRGLILTGIVPLPMAYEKPVVLNTPLVREGKAELELEDACTLDDEVLELVKLAEAEATLYVQGNRLAPAAAEEKKKTSENAKDFDEAAAHAENQSTRKPESAKKGKGKGKGKGANQTPLAVM